MKSKAKFVVNESFMLAVGLLFYFLWPYSKLHWADYLGGRYVYTYTTMVCMAGAVCAVKK